MLGEQVSFFSPEIRRCGQFQSHSQKEGGHGAGYAGPAPGKGIPNEG
jgi:hypothetical protein